MKAIYRIFCLLCGLSSQVSIAQSIGDYRTAQSAVSWSNPSHWQTWNGTQWVTASSIPGSGNDIYVQAGHTITLGANHSVNSIFISSGTSNATTGGDGQIILQDKILSCHGKLCCYFGTVNVVNGSGAPMAFTITSTTPSSPITKTSGGVLKFVGNTRTVTVANEWGANSTGSNALFDIEFALNGGEVATIASVIKAANWTIRSGVVNALVRLAVDNGTTGQGNFTLLKDATLISGETGSGSTPVISRTTSGICGTVTIEGLLKLTGISPHIQCNSLLTSPTATIDYARTGTQNFLASSYSGAATLLNYPNIILSGSGNKTTLASITTSLNSGGSLCMAGGSLVVGSSGVFSVSSDSTTLIYKATASQTATTTEWDTAFTHLVIANPISVTASFSRKIKGNLYLFDGLLSMGTNLELAHHSSIYRRNGILSGAPVFLGNVNVYYLPSNNLIQTGEELPSDSGILHNLEINNGNGVKLTKRVTVNGMLNLVNGLVHSTDSFFLTIGKQGNSSHGTDSSFVNGKLRKIGNSDFVFPIGSDSIWAALGISNLSGGNSISVTAAYYFQPPPDQSSLGNGLNKGVISNLEYWDVRPDTAISGAVTLFWNNGKRSGISSLNSKDLVVSTYSGTQWLNDSNIIILGNTDSGSICSRSRSSWGLCTFASPNKANPLPVKLLYFRSQISDIKGNKLEWATATEINSFGFEIERAAQDGKFRTIAFIPSAAINGSSSQKLQYSFIDTLLPNGSSFYRLRQLDFNGDDAYSHIVKCAAKTVTSHTWELRKNTLFLQNESFVSGRFKLFNSKGDLLEEQELFWGDSYDLGGRTPGIYYIQMDYQIPVKCYLD